MRSERLDGLRCAACGELEVLYHDVPAGVVECRNCGVRVRALFDGDQETELEEANEAPGQRPVDGAADGEPVERGSYA
ncbi:hypothetical protein DP939_42895 [Spongiactinospora rosea]|uniref:Uncharacterized protein n=1 Tax=Spongiactinospora rosea TaxID=2248750 RepID=A0A366LJF8_9ACTN|nr:hypothetical protein [Spongiactinospora rosea]RBQ14027.1 hypothetical protein DP939_42895 [Spongiactinospora rosea]